MSATLSAQHVVKRYGGVVALSDANLDIHSGEILALIGANGSGKSTMSKVINGVVDLDGGQLLLDGKPVRITSPQTAKKLGISTVFQELSLIPQMSIADNIWLTREPLKSFKVINRKLLNQKTEELLSLFEGTLRTKLKPDLPVSALSPDEKQIIEILKAISINPWLVILDEATASLDSRQVERLFELVRQWKAEGKAIIFVSHRMEEIFRIADRFSVLRNGKTVGDGNIKEITEKELIQLMIERENVVQFTKASAESESQVRASPVYLEIENLQTETLHGVSFKVHEGELVGIGGLRGQGQRDLLLSIFGDIPYHGNIKIKGKSIHFHHPKDAIQQGIALVPGERAREGLLYIRTILENLLLPTWNKYGFPLKIKKAKEDATRVGERLNLVMASLMDPVSSLSGGNAQKVVIGKWLLRNPQCYLLDDPTKGVDVNTKSEFYSLLTNLSKEGKTILFYSSDDDELVGLCDRVLVLHDGVIRAELKGVTLTKENLIAASLGVSNGGEV
ncbi:MAG: sugar ABC transporter ATP-binding protein [Anaerolineales bacterium]